MYRYRLFREPKKQVCPSCGKRRFVRYIDLQTDEILPDVVGRCDREVNCGYHLTPRQYFKENGIQTVYQKETLLIKPEKTVPDYHDLQLVKEAGRNFKQNNFIQYLKTIFSEEQTKRIILRYLLGTSKHWNGATVFWQIDQNNRVRGGKIMLYSSSTGKRVKKPFNHITWVHSVLIKKNKIKEFTLDQCLFGQHLLTEDLSKPVAIVESEKTACIMSELFDKYLWMACGSLSNISEKMFTAIKNRRIVLYPDLSPNQKAFKKWQEKSNKLKENGFDISVSRLLEEKSSVSQRKDGLDIADFFIRNKKKQQCRSDDFNRLREKNTSFDLLVKTFDLIFPMK